MKTSRYFASIIVAASLAAAAFGTVVAHAAHAVVKAVTYAFGRVKSFFLAPAPERTTETKPRVVLVAARSFVLKQMQRTRPLFTARWRMCPSA